MTSFHRGGWFVAGNAYGIVASLAAGNLSAGALSSSLQVGRAGYLAARGYQAYSIAGDVVGVVDSYNSWQAGTFGAGDLLGFAPTIGWATRGYAGVRALGHVPWRQVAGQAGGLARRGWGWVHSGVASKSFTPYGFITADEFGNFGAAITRKMRAAGYDDVRALLQGSGVTGVRARSKVGIPAGTTFDAIKASDFDIALVSPQLFDKAISLGIPFRGGKTRTGPLWPGNLRALGLSGIRDDLLRTLYQHEGRQINFMIYRSLEEAIKRPSIGIP